MLHDMKAEDIVGDKFQETTLNLYGGLTRKIIYTDIETPYPDGKLIVSTTDKQGIITHVNQSFVYMSGFEEEELIAVNGKSDVESVTEFPAGIKVAITDAPDIQMMGMIMLELGDLDSLGFQQWKAVDDEEIQFMNDLVDTLLV